MIHPIVAQMGPSEEQRPAVLERGRDIVVTAGAGTGKTRTLVARYLSLLAEDVPLRSVIAITFTRKAAREMRNRVRGEVRRYLERVDLPDDQRERWQSIYTGLDAARIGTIHSLCTEILRSHPAEARVDPRFEVLDEGLGNVMRSRAIEETLGWAADDEQAARLFDLLGAGGLQIALNTLLKQRLDAREAFVSLPDDPLAHWGERLSQHQQQAFDVLTGADDWRDGVAMVRALAASDPSDKLEVERRKAVAALRGGTGLLVEQLASLAGLAEVKLSGGSQKNWPGGKDDVTAVKDAMRTLRGMWKAQSDQLELRLTELDAAIAAQLPALRRAFDFACDRYDSLKRERQALDFDDLEQRALDLLRENATVRARWQRDARSILVDEFQDTNTRQRDLVAFLNGDGDKLFIVGDAKQSIYRFRGADVAVFRAERDRVAQCGGAAFALQTSYRAHAQLVDGLNDLLRPVLGERSDPVRPWAEPFAALRPFRVEAGPGSAAPFIELHLTVGSKSAGALDRAADALVGRLIELVEGGAQVEDGGELRALGYGDVAILCRASTAFGAYEDALERASVPFLTVAGRGFYGRAEIRDLLNALQSLADLTDDLALAGLLRSPVFGLSDIALYRLCQARAVGGKPRRLWDVLRGGDMALEGDQLDRVQRAVGIVEQLHERVGRLPVADVLKALLDTTDYRAVLIQAGQARGARNVSKLLADAHACGIVGVGEFLEYVANLRDAGTREGEARATTEGAVQIMSVHAAKGLEFPIVAIGDVTAGGRGSGGLLIDPDLGILPRLKDEDGQSATVYLLGKARSEDQDAAESDRLFYVAATRARERLLLSGCIGLKRDGTPGKLDGWLGKLGGDSCLALAGEAIPHTEDGAAANALDLQAGDTPVKCTIYEPGIEWPRRASAQQEAVERAILPPPLLEAISAGIERLDEGVMEQDRIPPQRVWRVVPVAERPSAPRWVIGSIVHESLAGWRFPDGDEGLFERWASARARSYGITDPRELADAVSQSRRLMLLFHRHPLYREMDGAERRLHEVPYSLMNEGELESGIIDALYLADGAWTIVEFKTDRVGDQADFERLLAETDYAVQAERYVAAVEQLLGERPACVLCWLNWAGGVRVNRVGIGLPKSA